MLCRQRRDVFNSAFYLPAKFNLTVVQVKSWLLLYLLLMKVSGGGCTDYLHGIYILQASRNYLSCFHSVVVVAGAPASRCYSLFCSSAQHLYGNSHLIACLCVCTTSFGLSADKRVVWLLFLFTDTVQCFSSSISFYHSLSLSFTWRDLLRPPGRKLGQSTKKHFFLSLLVRSFVIFLFLSSNRSAAVNKAIKWNP